MSGSGKVASASAELLVCKLKKTKSGHWRCLQSRLILTPINNVLQRTKRELQNEAKNITSVTELKQSIRRMWKNLPVNCIKPLYRTIPQRLRTVLKASEKSHDISRFESMKFEPIIYNHESPSSQSSAVMRLTQRRSPVIRLQPLTWSASVSTTLCARYHCYYNSYTIHKVYCICMFYHDHTLFHCLLSLRNAPSGRCNWLTRVSPCTSTSVPPNCPDSPSRNRRLMKSRQNVWLTCHNNIQVYD